MRKFPHFLHITEISASLAYFCPNLIAMATPLAPLKFLVTIFEFTDTENLTSHAKINSIFGQNYNQRNFCLFCPNVVAMANPLAPLKFFGQNYNQRNFGLFLPKFGCHGNSFGSLDIFVTIFEFSDPENLTSHAKIDSIFWTEVKLV